MGMSLMGADPVQITDAVDSSKTAADGWAASPASVLTAVNQRVQVLGIGYNTCQFRVYGDKSVPRIYFWVFGAAQYGSCNIGYFWIDVSNSACNYVNALTANNNTGYGSMSVTACSCSAADDNWLITIIYNLQNIWGTATVIPGAGCDAVTAP